MKFVRVLSRLMLLLLAAAAFVGLTGIYGSSARPPLPNPRYLAKHRYRPTAPQASQFLGFVIAGIELAIFAVGGRVLRLRLSPVPPSEGRPILLDLDGGRRSRQGMDPEICARHSVMDMHHLPDRGSSTRAKL